jgi:hypothetical protein
MTVRGLKHIAIACFAGVCMLLAGGCKKTPDKTKQPLIELNGKFLYVEDVQGAIPKGMKGNDSLKLAQNYIKKWATDVLIYEKAKQNIGSSKEIDKMVEEYRKSLIIHQYRQQMINERLSVPTEADLKEAYKQYADKLPAESDLILGVFVKVPNRAPYLANLKAWMQSCNNNVLDNIYKYSQKYAAQYQYFGDRWVSFADIAKNMPLHVSNPKEYLQTNKNIEIRDGSFTYLLHIYRFIGAGEQKPYEIAKDQLLNLLINQKKNDFMQNLEDEMYNDAVKNGDINYYTRNNK